MGQKNKTMKNYIAVNDKIMFYNTHKLLDYGFIEFYTRGI